MQEEKIPWKLFSRTQLAAQHHCQRHSPQADTETAVGAKTLAKAPEPVTKKVKFDPEDYYSSFNHLRQHPWFAPQEDKDLHSQSQ